MRKSYYLCKSNALRQMQSKFIQYLSSKNLAFQNNVKEQITFQSEGLNYLFVYDSSDSNFFRLLLPNIYSIEDNKDKCNEIVNNFNYTYKVVKAIVTPANQIWLSVEQFAYSKENIELLFERCILLLKATISLIHKTINETIGEGTAKE